MKVALLGASDKPDRYAYKALKNLLAAGHEVYPIHPMLKEIEGTKVYAKLADIPEKIDTLTLYVGPERNILMKDEIIALKPRRVVFNPGTENQALQDALQKAGIYPQIACTLVMLSINTFDRY
jgi:predicted CoA-binding protein